MGNELPCKVAFLLMAVLFRDLLEKVQRLEFGRVGKEGRIKQTEGLERDCEIL